MHNHPRIPLTFTVGHTSDANLPPARFIPATVPGAVQLDWAAAEGWALPEYNDHLAVRYAPRGVPILTDYEWMEDEYWLYRTRLHFAPPTAGERLYFVTAVDYACEVRLNGQALHTHAGLFTPIELDLTDLAHPGDLLEILVYPAPKIYHDPVDEKQAMQSCKPAFSYGWDYHPRLIPLGIWQETYLETRPACHIQHAEVRYTLRDDFSQADLTLAVTLSQPGEGALHWTLRDPQGVAVVEQALALPGARHGTGLAGGDARRGMNSTPSHTKSAEADSPVTYTLTASLASPQLWWPNGQGPQALYQSTVELTGPQAETRLVKIGFRTIRLVPFEGSWQDPDNAGFPNTCNKPPITLEVNGRRIFGKGSNWVGPDIFPGRITAETYRPLLQAAHAAHFNLLRCWGGAPVQQDAFFDLCDELGLLIWQEFPLACGRYEGTEAYLRVLDQESRSIIQRLRWRTCLALWCGGNELFNAWSGMTEQDLALRLLDRNCFDLDPGRPFIKTSPLMGMAHGGYQFRLHNGAEVFQYFAPARNTAYTEFGVPGPASADLLRRIIPAEELFPPRPGTHWQHRHAFKAWDGSPDSWLELWCIEHYFGQPESLEQLVEWGQWLQAEGLKCVFEEARRQKPRCSMALNWCFNEPWPNAANNSLLSWPAEAKPALAAVGAALRPVLASARLPKFAWASGETFSAELFLLNDSPTPLPAAQIEASIHVSPFNQPPATCHLPPWNFPAIPANTNLAGPTLRFTLPHLTPGPLILNLNVPGHPEWDSTYCLLAR
jgi:beta-mannosidase